MRKIKIISFLEKNTPFFPLGYLLRVGIEKREKEREQEWIKQSQISVPSHNRITLPLKSFIITKVILSSSESMIWFSHSDILVTRQWPVPSRHRRIWSVPADLQPKNAVSQISFRKVPYYLTFTAQVLWSSSIKVNVFNQSVSYIFFRRFSIYTLMILKCLIWLAKNIQMFLLTERTR